MINFSLLNSELDEESTLLSIKAQMPGNLITWQNVDTKHGKMEDSYMVCRFGGKVTSTINERLGTVVELFCREQEYEFNVTFVNKIADEIKEIIVSGQLSVDNYIALQRPCLAILYNNTNIQFRQIILGQQDNQSVTIWKSDSLFYIEPFHMQLTHLKGYIHMLFYELDHTGSVDHAVSNMCHLATPYGPVESLTQIAGSNAKFVAVATFIKRITPLKGISTTPERDCDVNVQLKFDEVLLKSKPYGSTFFTAFFFGELAKEIENAVNNRHIEPGDLIALIYPHFGCKTAAPINIKFPSYTKINLIILKNQYLARDIGDKVIQSDINLFYSNNFRTNQLLVDDGVEYPLIEFSSLKNAADGENALLKIHFKLKKYGDITLLKHLAESNIQPFKKGVILSYFLKLIKSYSNSNENDTVTLFLKEISKDCLYGAYFKLVLGQQFAKQFYLAIKAKSIVRGDIICFVNPVVWKNSTYTSSEKHLNYLVEIAVPEKQKIVVFKLREICVEKNNLETKQSKLLKTQDSIINPSRKTSRENEDIFSNNQCSELTNSLEYPLIYKDLTKIETHQTPIETIGTMYANNLVDNANNTNLKDKSVSKRHTENSNMQNKHKRIKVNSDNQSRGELDWSAHFLTNSTFIDARAEALKNLHRTLTRSIDCLDQGNTIKNHDKINESFHFELQGKQYSHYSNLNQSEGQHVICDNKTKSDITKSNKQNDNQTFSTFKEFDKQTPNLARYDERNNSCQRKLKLDQQHSKLSETERQHNICAVPLRSNKFIPINAKEGQQKLCKETCAIDTTCFINPHSIPEESFITYKNIDVQLNVKFPEYEQRFSLLPLLLSKPSLKNNLDLVSGFCKYGCKQMYPYSTTVQNHQDLTKRLCPRCFKMLKLDFCLELIATGLNKLITVLLHGAVAEKYLNITCEQFLYNNKTDRSLIVNRFKKTLENNKRTGKGRTFETTDVTYWWYK